MKIGKLENCSLIKDECIFSASSVHVQSILTIPTFVELPLSRIIPNASVLIF